MVQLRLLARLLQKQMMLLKVLQVPLIVLLLLRQAKKLLR
jgi:hypothetical protein